VKGRGDRRGYKKEDRASDKNIEIGVVVGADFAHHKASNKEGCGPGEETADFPALILAAGHDNVSADWNAEAQTLDSQALPDMDEAGYQEEDGKGNGGAFVRGIVPQAAGRCSTSAPLHAGTRITHRSRAGGLLSWTTCLGVLGCGVGEERRGQPAADLYYRGRAAAALSRICRRIRIRAAGVRARRNLPWPVPGPTTYISRSAVPGALPPAACTRPHVGRDGCP
jgi:hypothetical protein